MTIDERIQYLLRAASRAENEGHERVARTLRRMAEEFHPTGWTRVGVEGLATR